MGTGSSRVGSITWDVDRLSKASGLSRFEIEQRFTDYINASGRDGVMNVKEFIQVYSTLPAARLQSKGCRKDQATRIFHTFDRDHNGLLEFDEFLNAVVMMNCHTSQSDPIEFLMRKNNHLSCERSGQRIVK